MCSSDLGLYYWAVVLRDHRWGWWVAWLNLGGLVSALAGIDYAAAGFLCVTILRPAFGIEPNGETFGVLNAIWVTGILMAIQAAFAIAGSRVIAVLNDLSAWWHLAFVAAIVVALAAFGSVPANPVELAFSVAPGGSIGGQPVATVVPLGVARVAREGTDATIVAWGPAVPDALAAAATLAAEGIACEVIDLRTLVPWDRDAVLASVRRTSKVLVLHEDVRTGGFGGEIAATVAELAFEDLDAPIRVVGALDAPVPYAPSLEDAFLPGEAGVERAARLCAAGQRDISLLARQADLGHSAASDLLLQFVPFVQDDPFRVAAHAALSRPVGGSGCKATDPLRVAGFTLTESCVTDPIGHRPSVENR